MEFLDVNYLSDLEEKTLSDINFFLSFIGGGSTLFFISVFLFLLSILIVIKNESDFESFVEEKIKKIKRHRIQEKALSNFIKNFSLKKDGEILFVDIESNETYKKLVKDYEDVKVSIVFVVLLACIYPLYLLIKIVGEIENFFHFSIFEITAITALIVLIASALVGMLNEEKKYNNFYDVSVETFEPKYYPIEYPIVHTNETEQGYDIFFISGHKVKKIHYNGEIKLDKELILDNSIFEKKIITLEEGIVLEEPINEVIGYISINSYSESVNEYEKFKKENSKFLDESEFSYFLEDAFENIDYNEVSDVTLAH